MYNKELEKQLHELITKISEKSKVIVETSKSHKVATDRIMRLVSSEISSEAEAYMIDAYACLLEKIKEEDFFRNPDNLNAFYRLELREQLNEKYQFNIESIDAYKKSIEFKEINQIYMTIGAAAGTLALGGILKFALLNVINIPIAVVIAGSLAVACGTYFGNALKNKADYKRAVDKFLKSLENDILDWITSIEMFFDEQVRTLYKN